MKPKLLDLFCGAGGAAMGYHRAGFEVVGVDIKPQKHYPFEFHQADAMTYPLEGFDVIHASPPCQAFSILTRGFKKGETKAEDLIVAIRQRLESSGVPWVIENVVGAPLKNYIIICGSALGLDVWRHRLFELGKFAMLFPQCRHELVTEPWGVYSGAAGGRITQKRLANANQSREVMNMPWATQKEIGQAIPPAYTFFIGQQLMRYLNDGAS
jgi:DNA (cytosine-5)-methyltransferase 1